MENNDTIRKLEAQIANNIASVVRMNHPELGEERYRIDVSYIFKKTDIDNIAIGLKKHKFSGKVGTNADIGKLSICKVCIYDKTAQGDMANKPVDTFTLEFGDLQVYLDLTVFETYITERLNERDTDRVNRSATSNAAELKFKANREQNTTSNREVVSTAVVFSEGTYSQADKKFFKWWARDDSGNIYMKTKDGLVMCPIREGEDKIIKLDAEFWGMFWKMHRTDIIGIYNKVIAYCWDLRYKLDDAEVSEALLRRKIEESKEKSFIVMLHQWLPKSWMNRMAVIMNSTTTRYTDGKETHTDTRFEGFELGFFPSGMVTANPQPCTEENWEKMLASAVPRIELAEFELAQRFTNDPATLAIHRIQIGQWVRDSKTPQDLPKTWKMFLEGRLGDNLNSQLYRIAKWICSCLDATNFSRKVLVISGHGADGKSLFQSVLQDGFNRFAKNNTFARILPAAATEPNNTQNGLLECMDSRVLMTPDVTKVTDFLKSEVVKNITGCDSVTTQVKYRNPVTKNMSGTKLLVTTNAVTYLSDVYVDSRVSPIYFNRKDTSSDWDVMEIKKKLLDEFSEFVSWCFYFSYAKDAELGISHHVDPQVWSETASDTPDDVRAQWEALGSDDEPRFRYRKMDADAEVIAEDYEYILRHVLKEGHGFRCSNSEIRAAIANWARINMPSIKIGESGKDRSWKIIVKAIKTLFPSASNYVSHGVRGWTGIAVTTPEEAPKKSIRNELETTMPSM